ncbi:AI-2E family transporter [Pedobacter psychroterrae]|uniref:AI-2E family transporter n=1 Tax=Pedobacter psychroterrae TaxID=2530453 RepID=A0A4R0NPP6_9SPHI|nr:AI-2E family transporter [Pedobacter psychroterrae]TCD03000.1 AI-2E family transporter [Pedobacter psychroterrae]
MSLFTYKQRNNINLVIIIALGCLIAYSLQGIFGSILSTLVLYTILRPAYIWLTDVKGMNRSFSAILLLFLSIVVIILPFYALSSMVIEKIAELQSDPSYFKNMLFKLKHLIPMGNDMQNLVENGLQKAGTWATELFPSLISGAFNIVLGLLLMYFLLYFMLVDMEQFESALVKYAPFREQNAQRFAEEMRNTTYANVVGQGFIALVQGSLVSLAFYVLGYTDPLFWGIITTFISFVPILGPPVIFVPAALMQIANGNDFAGWGMLIFGFVIVINIDNVLRLIIAKRVGNIHPIITVLGVVIGIPLFGILGLVFGPLLLSYFVLLIKIYETSSMASERLERIKTISEHEQL